MRFIALDVHRDFCEVAISEDGKIRSHPRIPTDVEHLLVFAQSLAPDDHVCLEVTGNALAIVRILEPFVERVVLANAKAVRAITSAKVKTDKIDARTLVKLLAAGFLPEVWVGDEPTRVLRRRISSSTTSGSRLGRPGPFLNASKAPSLARSLITRS